MVSQSSFSNNNLLDSASQSLVSKSYRKLILLVDRSRASFEFLVSVIKTLNSRYPALVQSDLILSDGLNNLKQTIDTIFDTRVPNELMTPLLDSLEFTQFVKKLNINFNETLDIFVYFLSKFAVDGECCTIVLCKVFRLLNLYPLPPKNLVQSSHDSSDSSSDEMEVDKVSYNFDCLELLFNKCSHRSSNIHIASIAYLLIVKFEMPVIRTAPIRSLCLKPDFTRSVWDFLSSATSPGSLFSGTTTRCLVKLCENKTLSNLEYQQLIPPLTVFSSLFHEYLRASHDADILEENLLSFSVDELRALCITCRDLSVHLTSLELIANQPHRTLHLRSAFTNRHVPVPGSLPEVQSETVLGAADWYACWTSVTRLTNELYKRDSRVGLLESEELWLAKNRLQNIGKDNVAVFIDPNSVPNLSLNTIKELYLLNSVPFVVPFSDRINIFHCVLDEDASQVRGSHAGWGNPNSSSTVKASIRRDYIYEDAYAQLTESVAPNMKHRVMVQLVNYSGLDEAGVDGGGLFREFMASFLKEAFNPNRGFFIETDGLLHPNPGARQLYPDFHKHYFFIGRLLGKAVYEKLLVDIPLASYFLEKLLGGEADINHLRALDPNMYRNMLALRKYDAQALDDLCLSFIVSDNILGDVKSIELKPGGTSIQVTKSNLIEYIHLMADYRLNRQIRVHFRNFAEGFYSVLSPEWLKMFSYSEFQSLISGRCADIDIADLRNNTVYHGSYNADHPTICMFWDVVERMNSVQSRALLAFVTSSERTPLLGFKALNPLFAIHSAGLEDRLPTASTCMNLLKLPEFSDLETLEKRLMYVIESGAGFELS